MSRSMISEQREMLDSQIPTQNSLQSVVVSHSIEVLWSVMSMACSKEACHVATHRCAWSVMNCGCDCIKDETPFFAPLNDVIWCCLWGAILGFCPLPLLYLIRTQTISHFHSFLRLNYTLLSLVFNANHLTQSSQLHCQPNRSILWSFQPTHNLWNSGTPFCGFYLVHILCSLFCSHQRGWSLLSLM